MTRRFLILAQSAASAAVATMIAPAASATVYLTVEQAKVALFSSGTGFVERKMTLSKDQARAVSAASGIIVRFPAVTTWEARAQGKRTGWLIVDQVYGKHEFITYAVALDASGAVTGIEIMEYRETYGSEIRNDAWRAQFKDKRHGASLILDRDIKNISGATLSCKHVTDGVKRLLALHALVLKGLT